MVKKRHIGLLIKLTKGEPDWATHNLHREKAGKVDTLVKRALAAEKSDGATEETIDLYQAAMKAVIELNQSDPVAAAHRYAQAPINRLTIVLVKLKRRADAKEEYEAWRSIVDPVGLTKTDQEMLEKRMSKIE